MKQLLNIFIALLLCSTQAFGQPTIFLHKKQFPISVCNHRNCNDISVTLSTDTKQIPSCWVGERFTQTRHHWRTGFYIGPHYLQDYLDIKELEIMKIARADVYLNVGEAGNRFDLQGYDIDTPYTYEKVYPLIVDWFKWCTGGRMPSACSFAGGNEGYAASIKYDFLTGRNSKPLLLTDTPYYDYGINAGQYLGFPQVAYSPLSYAYNNRNTTTRFWDVRSYIPGWTLDSLMNRVRWQVDSVIAHNGWYQDFTHLHSLRTEGDIRYYDTLMKTIDDELLLKGKTAWRASAGEIAEYMAYRSSITDMSCFERNSKVIIELLSENAFYQPLLNTPVSVKVDLTGSALAGKDIKCSNAQLVKLDSNKWIVNVPFRNTDTLPIKIMRVELVEGTQRYMTTTAPVLSVNRVGSTVTITSDVPVYGTWYVRTANSNDDRLWIKQNRDLQLGTTKTITCNFTSYDYSFAAADPFNQTFTVVDIPATP